MWRTTTNVPQQGVWYGWTTLASVVKMAHIDAIAGSYPSDKLYDYSTIEGLETGSKGVFTFNGNNNNGVATPYQGSSTTDGITAKSLSTLIKGIIRYYRPSAYGGWSDIRFYNGVPINAADYTMPSSQVAMANLYYKDAELYDYYMFDTSKGYLPKQTTRQGRLADVPGGRTNDDMSPGGTLFIGSAWFEQESSFFRE
jgi:hypothetical protein